MDSELSSKNRNLGKVILRLLALGGAGITLNLVLSELSSKMGWPLYLDSVGTVLTAFVGGSLPGIAVGYLTNIIRTRLLHDSSSI